MSETNMDHLTIALSVLIHGEAVRFNRGKGQADDYDFKYLKGPSGQIYPYVSSQCFKKYWREALPGNPSPITRGKNSSGDEKNQVYTDGNPVKYHDDDLFGYMIAGAASEDQDEESNSDGQAEIDPSQIDTAIEALKFTGIDIKDHESLNKKLHAGQKPIHRYLRDKFAEIKLIFDAEGEPEHQLEAILIQTLNSAVSDSSFLEQIEKNLTAAQKKAVKSGTKSTAEFNREHILSEFKGELEQPKKRETTKRTSPIRMHALVAFSGVSTTKDFQTFARDVSNTGRNSVLNPNPVGIYSGWLKTRILVEASRIGKFYVSKRNSDILPEQVGEIKVQDEINLYSRTGEKVQYIELEEDERIERTRLALRALGNIGNIQGPASGALHDGSLRPKGFIGAFMNCADSPFDSIWRGTDTVPYLDAKRLCAILKDWNDLFASRKIYIGLPIEIDMTSLEREDLEASISRLGFIPFIDTPRQALLSMAADFGGG